MRRSVRVALAVGLVGGILVSTTVEAKKPSGGDRTEVCHRQGQARWKLKSLPPNAAAAHLAHGDGVPLGVVPDSFGLKFDASCEPVPFTQVNVAGPERDPDSVGGINAALDAFAARTGVPTNYVGTEDIGQLVEDAKATGQPPEVIDPGTGELIAVDILILPQPILVQELAAAGASVPAAVQTAATASAGWSDDWLEYGKVDGTLFAVPNRSDLKSLVWYKDSTFRDPDGDPYTVPTTFDELVALTDQIIANGQTPWCVGIESGHATGWNFTDWVEIRALGSQSPEFYDDWVANDIGFDDPRMRDIWNEVLALWNTPGAVFEGLGQPAPGVGIAQTNFFDSVFNLAAADECLMHRQAQFISFAFDPSDAQTFPFPADSNPIMGSGAFAAALRGDVEVSLVHEYFATADYADARHAAQPGGFLSAVQGQDVSVLGPFEKSFTETLQNADVFRFDASDLMTPAVGAGFPEQVGAPELVPDLLGPGLPAFVVPSQPTGFWGEGTKAVIGADNTVFDLFLGFVGSVAPDPPSVLLGDVDGKTVNDATQAVQDLFCTEAPGASCVP